MYARLVFLLSLVGATLPVCRVDATHPPLRVDDPNFKGQLIAPRRTLVTTPRPVSLRKSFQRAGWDAPVLGLPQTAHVVVGESWSLGSCSTFKGIPRPHRKHISPPATGPPPYRLSWMNSSALCAIASTADADRRPPQSTLRTTGFPQTFRVHFSDAELADLKRRITATRWPDRETVADASQGVRLAKLQERRST